MTKKQILKHSDSFEATLGKLETALRVGLLSVASVALYLSVVPPVVASPSSTAVVYPLMSPRVSSKYGKRTHPVRKQIRHHNGVDLAAPEGAPIRVIKDGVVIFSDTYRGFGKMVVVLHQGGITTHYGHCSELLVDIGQKVRAGQIVARVGSTGLSTGPHLHFEVRKHGKHLNPERFLPEFGERGEG